MLRAVLRLLAAGLAVTLTVLLAREPASGAFTAATGAEGNEVSAAPDFCETPDPTLAEDSWVEQRNPTDVNVLHPHIHVRSEGGARNRRGLLTFALPGVPTGCHVVSATLRLYNSAPASGRVIGVYRAAPDATWDIGTAAWDNHPAHVGTPALSTAGAAVGWQTWDVTAIVGDLYAVGNNGLVVRDQAEGGAGVTNRYDSRDLGGAGLNVATDPELLVEWG